MTDRKNPQSITIIFQNQEDQKIPPRREKLHGRIRQDKIGFASDRIASPQPDRIADELQSGFKGGISARIQINNTYTGTLEPLQIYIPSPQKRETERIARENKLSKSCAGRYIYDRGLQFHTDMQYGDMLVPVITTTLTRGNQGTKKMLHPMSRDLQIVKHLCCYILRDMPGMTEAKLEELLDEAAEGAEAELTMRLKNHSQSSEHQNKDENKDDSN